MNKSVKIFVVIVLMIISGYKAFAQTGLQQNDTLRLTVKRSGSNNDLKDQDTKKVTDILPDKENNAPSSRSVKNLRASRPDMSKARNARPPNIVRPSGSRIPNGIGRPAGAARAGH
jgi:hypothetical protein